jgi:transposase
VLDTAAAQPQSDELKQHVALLEGERDSARSERDEYKKLYVALLEAYRKLEAGLTRHSRERYVGSENENGEQLALTLLSMMVGEVPEYKAEVQDVEAHERRKPTGRKPLPENLPRIEIEVLPPDVRRLGTDAFERIGEEASESIERRPASTVVVRTVRPKYVWKQEMPADTQKVLQAEAPELPIPRAIAGPGFLADTVVKRWQDHLPLYRMERIYGREGLPLARSTICGWHQELAKLVAPLVVAMWKDAFLSPLLCVDATGVLVQAKEKCRTGHFFVVVAPKKHVLFGYAPKHNAAAVDKLLSGYQGFLVADAHSVYEHLYKNGDVVEVGCWAHTRRYWFKALDSDGERAQNGLLLIQALFRLEREYGTLPPEVKLARRQKDAKPIVHAFFAFCDDEALKVLDETPISKAIGYARNQRDALHRFLSDGRLPIHNNWSENALRREALGRRNWLFVGNDEGGNVNATLVSLLASSQLHGLEPLGYLRDLFCLLPSWPVQRVLELAPANWAKTIEREDVKTKLDANIYRQAALGVLTPNTS